jgi:hypothetical protein
MKARFVVPREDEQELLENISIRLISQEERPWWDRLVEQFHYLKSAEMVGECLRYAVQGPDGLCLALIGWSSAAYHLRPREQWIGWSEEQRQTRRKFIAQNSRFVLLVDREKFPNLASRILALCLDRLSEDWLLCHRHPVWIAETFVDRQRFQGTCYKASGWKLLGPTGGFSRSYRDFYVDLEHPKELWVYPLHKKALCWLRAEQLPEHLRSYEEAAAPRCPHSSSELASLWQLFHQHLTDRRAKRGQRHLLATVFTIAAVATLVGEKGPKGFAEFSKNLSQPQRRNLRCRRHRQSGKFDVPSEATFRRAFKRIETKEFMDVIARWQAQLDPDIPECVAVDGKTIKGSRRADGRQEHVLSAVTHHNGRLLNQMAIAEKSNEITAFEPLMAPLPLAGVTVTADAEHTQRRAAQFLVQEKLADYFFILKDNQPTMHKKAQQLLRSALPPSGGDE